MYIYPHILSTLDCPYIYIPLDEPVTLLSSKLVPHPLIHGHLFLQLVDPDLQTPLLLSLFQEPLTLFPQLLHHLVLILFSPQPRLLQFLQLVVPQPALMLLIQNLL